MNTDDLMIKIMGTTPKEKKDTVVDIKVRFICVELGKTIRKTIDDWVCVEVENTDDEIKKIIEKHYYTFHESNQTMLEKFEITYKGKFKEYLKKQQSKPITL